MQKPNDYDAIQAPGEFTPIQLGGHKLVIKQVEELTASNGKPYLKVSFDTSADDAQPKYYEGLYRADTRENKKWQGVATVFVQDPEGATSKQFKGFCTSIEHSNNGFSIVWGDGFCNALKNKAVGGVFREEEYLNTNKELKVSRKLAWFRGVEGIADVDVPEKKCLSGDDRPAPTSADGFVNVQDGLDELPFN